MAYRHKGTREYHHHFRKRNIFLHFEPKFFSEYSLASEHHVQASCGGDANLQKNGDGNGDGDGDGDGRVVAAML